jgi:hypothetical protein
LKRGFIVKLGRAAGVSKLIASRAWELGNPDAGLAPLQSWPDGDVIDARARRAQADDTPLFKQAGEALQEAADDAIIDAATTKIEETRMVQRARRGAMGLIDSMNELIEGMAPLAGLVHGAAFEIAQSMNSEDGIDIAVAEKAASVIWKLTQAHQAATASAERLLKAERQLLGGPDEVIGVQAMGGLPTSEEDILHRLQETHDALKRDRERREGGGDQ